MVSRDTYVERDLRLISNAGDLTSFQRLVDQCAGGTSQLLNFSRISNDCGIAQPTAKGWFSVLDAAHSRPTVVGYGGETRQGRSDLELAP